MSKPTDPAERLNELTPELLEVAKRIIVEVLAVLPSGGLDELAARIVDRVAISSSIPVDEEALSDKLQPFELLDCVYSGVAEDDSDAFMGPNWCAFSVYELSENDYLVVQDFIEEHEYEVCGSASSFGGASKLIQERVIDRLGKDRAITFSDGSTITPEGLKENDS